MKKTHLKLLIGLCACIGIACQKDVPKADLIIYNASIWTGNDAQKRAQAMAIAGDTILTVGIDKEILKHQGENTRTVNMKGRFVAPGFIDSHVHLITGGNNLLDVRLRDARTPEEFIKRVTDYAKNSPPGDWILGGKWNHNLWGGKLPKKEWIDEYTEENPTLLFRMDFRMALANTTALAYAGIDRNTPDVKGGKIVRDKHGYPTGILSGNAIGLVLDKIPPMTEEQKEHSFWTATRYFLSNGITTVHDVDGLNTNRGSYSSAWRFYKEKKLFLRIYAIAPLNDWERMATMERKDNKWIKTGGLKGFVDGSLVSHTACFRQEYNKRPGDKGIFINSRKKLYRWISKADSANLQVMIHAVGDSAVHTLLNLYEQVGTENGPKDRRFRIEHAQHIPPEDIARFAQQKIIASIQPYHIISDGRWTEQYIGAQRAKEAFPLKSLLENKTSMAFGSDWAVAPASPLMGIYAAVTRRTLDDKHPKGWMPEQKITVEQALKAYTSQAAYASFDENIKGTLEAGKLADFVVLSEDITQIEPASIEDVAVLATYVGGVKVYDYQDTYEEETHSDDHDDHGDHEGHDH